MLLFLIVLALVVVLLAANLENRASFSFVLRGLQLEQVPVFLALLVAFIAGALTMLPFTIGRRQPRARKDRQAAAGQESSERPPGPEPAAPIAPPRDAPLPAGPPETGRRGGKRKPRRRRRERAA